MTPWGNCARKWRPRLAELSRANELLSAENQRKDEFLTTLAHELRNPLATLAAAVELIRVYDSSSADGERIVGVLERQVRRLCKVVDELLDVAWVMRNRAKLHKQRVDLKNIITQALEAARPHLDARRHHLQISWPDQPLPVEADPSRLTQVFVNLLDNAAKFTQEAGHIWVGAEIAPPTDEECRFVAVSVRDDGIGMTQDMAGMVFDLFAHRNGAASEFGFGLTLVRRLTRLHGGSISVVSEGLGKGSVFIVRLPLKVVTGE